MWYLLFFLGIVLANEDDKSIASSGTFSIEGEVILPSEALASSKWHTQTRVLLNHGQFIGFVRPDGTFRIDGIPSGSFIVQIENVDYVFEPIRVDVTGKGKIRARKLTILQPNAVNQIPYPLKMSAREQTRYFRKREEWRITDFLFSPTFLMLGLPMLVLLVVPKLVANDPEMQREMENMQMPKMDMPDVSEMMANFFNGNQKPKKKAVTSGASSVQPNTKRK